MLSYLFLFLAITGCGKFPKQLTKHTNGGSETSINVSKPELTIWLDTTTTSSVDTGQYILKC